MRTIKEPETRKNEIIDVAERLFAYKGYDAATINDILTEVNIAKGTFYYYFKSKEDILDAIVRRRNDLNMERAEAIAAMAELGPKEKLLAIIMSQKPQNPLQKDFNAVIHEPENSKLHQKVLVDCVQRLSPIMCRVVEEGIGQGIFNTHFPKQCVEILLTSAIILFDDAYFQWEPDEMAAKIPAFLNAMERILGAGEGSLSEFTNAFG